MEAKVRYFSLCSLSFYFLSFWASPISSNTQEPSSSTAVEVKTLLSSEDVLKKFSDAFSLHFQHSKLTPQLAQRTAQLFIKQLDPMKSLFLQEEVESWILPYNQETKSYWEEKAATWSSGDFDEFYEFMKVAQLAYDRKKLWMDLFNNSARLAELSKLATQLLSNAELENLDWCTSNKELEQRIAHLFSLNLQIHTHLYPARSALQHLESAIEFQRERGAEVFPPHLHHKAHVWILKSLLQAFDPHSSYLTHEEASQFLRDINRKFSGIGVHLREEIEGYRVVSILPGTPAEASELGVGDHIVAVDGKSILELDIAKGVEKIQGPPGTSVSLTISVNQSSDPTAKKLKDIEIYRQEISLQDQRFQVQYFDLAKLDEQQISSVSDDKQTDPLKSPEISTSGKVLHYQLFSFYGDKGVRASQDLKQAIERAQEDQKKGPLEAVILDLRYNMGGSMQEAIHVAGLFLNPGVVLAAKDQNGNIIKERSLNISPVWQGPLIVLVNRKSASSSEIVTGALKDYGRALIIGDEQTYGKGSFQLLSSVQDPKGALSVTQGTYYTVSGHSPQLHGIAPHIVVPGKLGPIDEGEAQTLFPLPASTVEPMFTDLLEDVSFFTRQYMKSWYFKKKQEQWTFLDHFLPALQAKSKERQKSWPENKVLESNLPKIFESDRSDSHTDFDQLQLQETLHLTRDLLQLLKENPISDLCSTELQQSAA